MSTVNKNECEVNNDMISSIQSEVTLSIEDDTACEFTHYCQILLDVIKDRDLLIQTLQETIG